ncbi:hypothetical protein OSTOST_13064, partial [Ostertagia ostertagi]
MEQDPIASASISDAHSLQIYNSPISEELAFNLSVKHLVEIGYPEEVQKLKYKTKFVVRNAWFDKRFGNLLKTDEHCNILTAFHGLKKLDKSKKTGGWRTLLIVPELDRELEVDLIAPDSL